MQWLTLALLGAFFVALLDLFIKLSIGKIHDGLGGTILTLVAALPLLIYTLWEKFINKQLLPISTLGLFYSVIGGLSIGIGTILIYKMFATGTNLSLAVPVLRLGTLLIGTLFGLVLLKEGFSNRSLVGFLFSLIGLYLLVTSKV